MWQRERQRLHAHVGYVFIKIVGVKKESRVLIIIAISSTTSFYNHRFILYYLVCFMQEGGKKKGEKEGDNRMRQTDMRESARSMNTIIAHNHVTINKTCITV